nr:S8 family peptidase [Lachnospiraceae bacterium]
MRNWVSRIVALLLAVCVTVCCNGSIVFAFEEDYGTIIENAESSEAVVVDADETVAASEDADDDMTAGEESDKMADSGEELTDEVPDVITEPADEITDELNGIAEDVDEPTEEDVEDTEEDIDSFMTAPIPELDDDQLKNTELLEKELKKLEKLTPDDDYVPNEAVFLADSEEEALMIADSYGAELEHYDMGVATICWPDKKVGDAFQDIVDDVDLVLEAKDRVESAGYSTFCLATVQKTDKQLFERMKDIDVENIPDTLVEPNHISHIFSVNPSNDPLYTGSNPGDTTKQWFHAAVNSAAAWSMADGSGVTVAVIDTGIDTSNNDLRDSSHPDHIEALWSSDIYSPGEDDNGHGSHCCGIVAALDNTVGGLGIAPNAKIISIKAANYRGQLRDADINKAISMAIERNVDIISMSFGGPSPSSATEKLLKKAVDNGITCIAAAGNDSTNEPAYPGAYDCTVCVGAIDPYADGRYALAKYSNWGRWVDIAAPGSQILSTVPGGYGVMDGTSMATPLVAGVAALIKSAHPDYSPEQIRNALLNSSPDKVYEYSYHLMYRGVDAAAAINASTSTPKEITGPEFIDDSGLNLPSISIPGGHALTLGVGDSVSIAQGKSVTIGAVLLPADKTKIQYSCKGDEGISVTSKGLIKVARTAAVGSSAVVTATWKDLSAETTVTVIEGSSILSDKFIVKKSHNEDLSVAKDVGRNYVELSVEPADASAYYRYTVSGKNAALFENRSTTIVAKGNTPVKLYAAANGSVTVTAFSTDGSGKKATEKVICFTPITGIDITYSGVPIKNTIHMAPGAKLKLGTNVYGTSVSAVSGKVNYTWETTSGSENIVNKGIISTPRNSLGKSYTVKVSAENNGYTKSASLNVIVDKAEKIKKLGWWWRVWGSNKYFNAYPSAYVHFEGSLGGELDIEEIINNYDLAPLGFYTTPSKGNPSYESYDLNSGNFVVSVAPDKISHVQYGDYGIKKFTPTTRGKYKVVFSALDGSGKTASIDVV